MAGQAPLDAVVSHWSTLIENFQVSPLAFYEAVESALKRREIPATDNERVDYKEAGLLSAKREYLHVTREKLVFDICGAPFGTGFFVSWWLAAERPKLNPMLKVAALLGMALTALWIISQAGLILGILITLVLAVGVLWIARLNAEGGEFDDDIIVVIPLIGSLYLWLFKPGTYYRLDSTDMFQKAVHNAVLEVIDTMTAEKGIRALSETERKPIMREFYTKKSA